MGSKTSGIKIVTQVLGDLAAVWPQVVLSFLPHLESERSGVQQAGHPGDDGLSDLVAVAAGGALTPDTLYKGLDTLRPHR